MDLLLQLMANGLVNGAFYGLSALGLTLIFGLMRVVNFAHGDLYMVGGLLGASFTATLGVNLFVAIVCVVGIMAASGYVIERLMVSRVRSSGEDATILLTLGLSIFLANTAQLIVGTAPQKVILPLSNAPLFVGPVVLTQSRLFVVAICVVFVALSHLIIRHTKAGRAMRAVFQDPMAAQLVGIRSDQIFAMTFALGTALAGVAGLLLGAIYVAQASVGGLISLKAFVIVILGGMGSFAGAILGGLILGIAEAMFGGYVATGYVDAIGFALVIVMLLVRPYGLFSTRAERA